MPNFWVSLGHIGRRRVILGPSFNTRQHVITNKSHHVLSKCTILHWATFVAILGRMRPTGCRLDTPGSGPVALAEGQGSMDPELSLRCVSHTQNTLTPPPMGLPHSCEPMQSGRVVRDRRRRGWVKMTGSGHLCRRLRGLSSRGPWARDPDDLKTVTCTPSPRPTAHTQA